MREIKFRAWDSATKDFWEPKPQGMIHFGIDSVPDFINHTHNESGRWERRFKIMQFTGLTDKNGVEIYDGDIVAFWDDCGFDNFIQYLTGKVVFNDGCFCFVSNDAYHNRYALTCTENVEVIGNIHQNPDLMK